MACRDQIKVTPRHPATRVGAEELAAVESRLDVPRLVAMGCDGASMETFEFPTQPSVADVAVPRAAPGS